MNSNNSMICITASGYLESDCEVKSDRNGNKYIRFKMICSSKDTAGQTVYIPFRCFSYNTRYTELKKGDVVFVMGEFKYSKFKDKINFDIFVQQICQGGMVNR